MDARAIVQSLEAIRRQRGIMPKKKRPAPNALIPWESPRLAESLISPGHSGSIPIHAGQFSEFQLPDRARLPSFHLDQEDPILLAGLHFGNSR